MTQFQIQFNDYQHRFVAFARVRGVSPGECLTRGLTRAYVLWIRDRWAEWRKLNPGRMNPAGPGEHADFDKWLSEVTA